MIFQVSHYHPRNGAKKWATLLRIWSNGRIYAASRTCASYIQYGGFSNESSARLPNSFKTAFFTGFTSPTVDNMVIYL